MATLFSHTIRDPLWKDIPLSEGFKALYQSSAMQHLNGIKQLGPAYLLYPGAVHSRLNHSLGVYHATRLILEALEGSHPLRPNEVNALLAAALLHDIGHFPYAHALKDIVRVDHETLAARILEKDEQLQMVLQDSLDVESQDVASIIDTSISGATAPILFSRNILSGTLDPDKLDYLSRDALFCGIPYGIQDASYIIRNLSLSPAGRLSLPLEAIGSIHALLFAKHSMYRTVYWHPVTRSATAMIKKAVLLGFEEQLFSEQDLYGLDDASFGQLMRTENSLSKALYDRVQVGRLFKPLISKPYLTGRMYADFALRQEAEKEVWEALSPHFPDLRLSDVIVDIPEEISFEADIPLKTEQGSYIRFAEADTLFSPTVISSFVSSLRMLRLYVSPEVITPFSVSLCKGVLHHYD
ncbi:MAG: HD domain-containing protein [Sphaerochaetaceae bacterium]